MSLPRDATAVVGVGATPYFKRGTSVPLTVPEMAGTAILAALDDAGLSITDLDGFAYHSGGHDTALLAQILGVPDVRFSATVSGGGGGSVGSVALAAGAVVAGQADVCVAVLSLQQATKRLGAAFAERGGSGAYAVPMTSETDFVSAPALFAPGQMFALLTQRHMYQYGTRREHLAEIAISTRANAITRDTALHREPLTLDDYFASPMLADPLCRLDHCQESDGAVAVVVTSARRAADLRRPPVYVRAAEMGGAGEWGQAIGWMGMPDDVFASSGHRPVAQRLWAGAGLGPEDVDVALLYDHFTSMVLMQLEDYGFCKVGEGGPFVADGHIRYGTGSIPVNTHGGNLSEAYIIGMTHIKEAVEQLRGAAVNQVDGAEVALVTGGPASLPLSGLVLRR